MKKITYYKKIKSLIFLFFAGAAFASPEEKELAEKLFQLYLHKKIDLEDREWSQFLDSIGTDSLKRKAKLEAQILSLLQNLKDQWIKAHITLQEQESIKKVLQITSQALRLEDLKRQVLSSFDVLRIPMLQMGESIPVSQQVAHTQNIENADHLSDAFKTLSLQDADEKSKNQAEQQGTLVDFKKKKKSQKKKKPFSEKQSKTPNSTETVEQNQILSQNEKVNVEEGDVSEKNQEKSKISEKEIIKKVSAENKATAQKNKNAQNSQLHVAQENVSAGSIVRQEPPAQVQQSDWTHQKIPLKEKATSFSALIKKGIKEWQDSLRRKIDEKNKILGMLPEQQQEVRLISTSYHTLLAVKNIYEKVLEGAGAFKLLHQKIPVIEKLAQAIESLPVKELAEQMSKALPFRKLIQEWKDFLSKHSPVSNLKDKEKEEITLSFDCQEVKIEPQNCSEYLSSILYSAYHNSTAYWQACYGDQGQIDFKQLIAKIFEKELKKKQDIPCLEDAIHDSHILHEILLRELTLMALSKEQQIAIQTADYFQNLLNWHQKLKLPYLKSQMLKELNAQTTSVFSGRKHNNNSREKEQSSFNGQSDILSLNCGLELISSGRHVTSQPTDLISCELMLLIAQIADPDAPGKTQEWHLLLDTLEGECCVGENSELLLQKTKSDFANFLTYYIDMIKQEGRSTLEQKLEMMTKAQKMMGKLPFANFKSLLENCVKLKEKSQKIKSMIEIEKTKSKALSVFQSHVPKTSFLGYQNTSLESEDSLVAQVLYGIYREGFSLLDDPFIVQSYAPQFIHQIQEERKNKYYVSCGKKGMSSIKEVMALELERRQGTFCALLNELSDSLYPNTALQDKLKREQNQIFHLMKEVHNMIRCQLSHADIENHKLESFKQMNNPLLLVHALAKPQKPVSIYDPEIARPPADEFFKQALENVPLVLNGSTDRDISRILYCIFRHELYCTGSRFLVMKKYRAQDGRLLDLSKMSTIKIAADLATLSKIQDRERFEEKGSETKSKLLHEDILKLKFEDLKNQLLMDYQYITLEQSKTTPLDDWQSNVKMVSAFLEKWNISYTVLSQGEEISESSSFMEQASNSSMIYDSNKKSSQQFDSADKKTQDLEDVFDQMSLEDKKDTGLQISVNQDVQSKSTLTQSVSHSPSWVLELECEIDKEELRDFFSDPQKKICKSSIPSKLLFDRNGQKNEIDLKEQGWFSWQKAFAELNVGTEFSWPQEQRISPVSPDLLIKIQNLIKDSVDFDRFSDIINLWQPSKERIVELLSNSIKTCQHTSIETKAQFCDKNTIGRLNTELPDWKNAEIRELRWFKGERAALETVIQAFDNQVNNFGIDWHLQFGCDLSGEELLDLLSNPGKTLHKRLSVLEVTFDYGGTKKTLNVQRDKECNWENETLALEMGLELRFSEEQAVSSDFIKRMADLIHNSAKLDDDFNAKFLRGFYRKSLFRYRPKRCLSVDSFVSLLDAQTIDRLNQELPDWKKVQFSEVRWFEGQNASLERVINFVDNQVTSFRRVWMLEFACTFTSNEVIELLSNPEKKLYKQLGVSKVSFNLDGQKSELKPPSQNGYSWEKEVSELKMSLEIGWAQGQDKIPEKVSTLVKKSAKLAQAGSLDLVWGFGKIKLLGLLSSFDHKVESASDIAAFGGVLGQKTTLCLDKKCPGWKKAQLSEVRWFEGQNAVLQKVINALDNHVKQININLPK